MYLSKVMSFISQRRVFFLLLIILALGIFLRIFHLWDTVIFAYDQARDAQRIMGIISLQHFKLVGPETDIPGVFNGALFYYLLAPFYLLSHFNPNGPAIGVAVINILGALLIFYTAKVLFENKYIGVLAAFFWAISYEQIAYSHYISNSSFMGISSLIFFLGCALYFIKKKDFGLPLSAIGLGLAANFNFYLLYLGIFYVILASLFRRKHSIKAIVFGLIILGILLSPFGLAELQFKFATTKAMIHYIFHQGSSGQGLGAIVGDGTRYLTRITDAIYFSYFSFNTYLAFFLLGFFVVYTFLMGKERKSLYFLYIWVFSTLPLFIFHSGVLTVEVINSSIQGALAILMAIGIWILFKTRKTLVIGAALLGLIVISNALLLIQADFVPNNFFVSEPMTIGAEKQVIDYTYREAGGEPFSICALTNPLLINTVWGYLYNWYGKEKYGYLPYWAGWRQDISESLLPYDIKHVKLRFLIKEPIVGITFEAPQAFVYMEDNTSILLGQQNFGGIIVQKRKLQNGTNRKFIDTQGLTDEQAKELKRFTEASPYYSCYNTY